MGSEEDDVVFVRRNKQLQEAITKQVIEAMEKMMDEKLQLLRQEKQTQSSDHQREPRRNRRGRHAGPQETDNYYTMNEIEKDTSLLLDTAAGELDVIMKVVGIREMSLLD